MKRIGIGVVVLMLLVSVGFAGAGWWGYRQWSEPGMFASPVRIFIPKGTRLSQIADLLVEAKVLDEGAGRFVFMAGARLTRLDAKLRAGEFDLPASASPEMIASMLAGGGGLVQHTLTIAEGLTTAEILALVREMPELDGEVTTFPREGSLLPETYAFLRGDSREGAVRRMAVAMAAQVEESWGARAEGLPLATPAEAVILASIVEKETALATERPRVAAVFINRLRLGMPLQSDPTVIYGLTKGKGPLDRPLLRKDLEADHPWNTYTRPGLPKGPIANPGKASLEAVLHPATTKDIYFVADGSGGHAFASTLEEHNRNVARWRKLQRDGQPTP